jgi:hypothetical protein
VVPTDEEIQRLGRLFDMCRAKHVSTIRIGELTFALGPVPVEPPEKSGEPSAEEDPLLPQQDDLADLLHGAK